MLLPPVIFFVVLAFASLVSSENSDATFWLGEPTITDKAPSEVDGWVSFSRLDPNAVAPLDGKITMFKYFGSNSNGVDIFMYRLVPGKINEYKVVDMVSVSSTTVGEENVVEANPPINVKKGDMLGYTWDGLAAFGFDGDHRGKIRFRNSNNSGGPKSVGETWKFDGHPLGRRYHIAAFFIPSNGLMFSEPNKGQQCWARDTKVQYPGDSTHQPSIETTSQTLNECKARCSYTKDSYGRPCVAVEWEDWGNVQNENEKRKCSLMWACDYMTSEKQTSVFQAYERAEEQCLPSIDFGVMVSGPCSYNKLISSVQQMLNDPDPQTHSVIPCPHNALSEIQLHIPVNTTTAELIKKFEDVCKMAQDDYFNKNHVPWSDVTLMGDKFDKEYYDGNGDWNEEHQSNYPHPPVVPGEASNVLNRDAERVDDLYENHLQRYSLQWPGDAPTSMTNFANCELQSAMCCFVSDRQANDNNRNCKTPYDERCLDADPGDNTDLCAVDMTRSGDSPHVNDGFAIFQGDEEGPVHCHGLAWGMDEFEADSRYKANNLFYVSMSDHLHDRGYVRNVQGAPICACVEQMPIVSRSDCTEISAKEFYKFSFSPVGDIEATLDYVDINFNACRARRNNNLERFYERLRDEGRVTQAMYDKFRETVVGDNQCSGAVEDMIFEKGFKYQAPEYEGWTMLYGRGSMISADSNPGLWTSIDQGSYIRRVCKSCDRDSHKDIIYKRLTAGEEINFRELFLKNWFSDPEGEGKNIRGNDFNLFSSFDEAKNDQSAWTFC